MDGIDSLEPLRAEHHNPVPEWVAGMVGGLSTSLLVLVVVCNALTAKPRKEEAGERNDYRTGLLLSLFGGHLYAAIVTSFLLWFLLTLSVMLPFFWFSQPEEVKPRTGNVTASINFCEGPDFHHSEVLAEPVNVVTSVLFYLPVGLIGLLGPACKEGRGELRFLFSYGSIGLVGIGSGALHASLDAVAQAGDELPMLYAAAMLAYCCADTFLIKKGMLRASAVLPWITALITSVNTLVYVGSRDDFGIFAATFALYSSVSVFYFSSYCLRRVSAISDDIVEGPIRYQVVRPLSWGLGASLAIGGICWALEMGMYSAVINYQQFGDDWAPFIWRYMLHSLWHAGTAMAAMLMIQNLITVRAMQMGWGRPKLDWCGLPYVRFDVKAD